MVPVRPMPVWISSRMSRRPRRFLIFSARSHHFSGGMMPPTAWTGSAMMAAVVSLRASSFFSASSRHWVAQSWLCGQR